MRHALAAFLIAGLLAIAATWPAAVDPGAMVGHYLHPDCLSNHWLLVWVSEQLSTGGSLLHNDRYYWPVGDTPLLAGNGSEGFLVLPFYLLLGWPGGVSAYVITIAALGGLASFWAARQFGASPTGALMAAPFAVSPYVLGELSAGRFTQSDVIFLALALGAFARIFARQRKGLPVGPGDGALAGLCWGLTAVLYWFYGYFVALAVLIAGVHQLWRFRRVPWAAVLGFAVVGGLVVAGPLSWYFAHWDLIPGTGELSAYPHRETEGDSLPWHFPVHFTRAAAATAQPLPVVLLALYALARGLRRRHDGAVQAGLIGLTGYLLAGGPHLFGTLVPSPFDLAYGHLSVLRRFWWPSRHLVLVHFAGGVLASLGATWLLQRWKQAYWVPGLLALGTPVWLMAAGDLFHTHVSRFSAPPVYRELAQLEPGVVLELPLSPTLAGTQVQLVWQLVHRKPLLTGHAHWVDRVRPDAWDVFVVEHPVLRSLADWEEDASEVVQVDAADHQALLDLGLRYVVLNPENLPLQLKDLVTAYRRTFDALYGAPVLRDGQVRVYDLANWTGETDFRPPAWKMPPNLRRADGAQPVVGRLPNSVGLELIRGSTMPMQGIHPVSAPPRH